MYASGGSAGEKAVLRSGNLVVKNNSCISIWVRHSDPSLTSVLQVAMTAGLQTLILGDLDLAYSEEWQQFKLELADVSGIFDSFSTQFVISQPSHC